MDEKNWANAFKRIYWHGFVSARGRSPYEIAFLVAMHGGEVWVSLMGIEEGCKEEFKRALKPMKRAVILYG